MQPPGRYQGTVTWRATEKYDRRVPPVSIEEIFESKEENRVAAMLHVCAQPSCRRYARIHVYLKLGWLTADLSTPPRPTVVEYLYQSEFCTDEL